jgi:methylmalonyl-CoA/ethylmalonyl-CoA epimerase
MKKNSILWILPVITMIVVSSDMGMADTRAYGDLGTKTVAHVAIIVRDIEKTTRNYAEIFGMEPPGIRLGASPEYMGKPTEGKAKMAFINLENITLEFFEPVGGPSAWQEFLDRKGEGVHHFGFWVEGLDEHVKVLGSRNMPVVQSGGGDWGRYRYVDATAGLAVMIELLERNKSQ